MKNMNGVFEFSYVNKAPFSQDVDTNFLNSSSYAGQRLPIARLKSALNSIKLKTRFFARFFWKIPKIVEARTYEIKRFHVSESII